MIARLAAGRIHYAWLVAGMTFVLMLGAAGVRSIPGVLFLPLEGEFGWSRAAISLAVSVNLFLFGLCGPFAASVMERVGMRAMMVAALALLGVAALATTRMTAVWQLQLLWGVVVGLGAGALAGWVAAAVANRWFVDRRGLVVGVLTAANATGQLIFLPIVAALVEQRGWRTAVTLPAVVALVLVPFVWLVIRSFPSDVGLRPFGARDDGQPIRPRAPLAGNPFARAFAALGQGVRDRDFRFLAATFFICGASTNGLIGTHLIPAAMDHGYGEVAAASLLATIGVFDIVGTTCSGWLTDRHDPRVLLFWYYGLRGLSLLALPYVFGSPHFGLILFVVFYGLDWIATVPPTVALTAEIFGRDRVGTVFGWIFCSHMFGAAFAAWGAGAIRTWFGGYGWAFGSAGLLCLFASGLVMQIERGPRLLPAPAVA